MAKNDNLKDFLTDLYEGIASKKPNASRNPQNFRSEIESISGGEFILGKKYEGTPFPNDGTQVNKIYLNTKLTSTEINEILEEANLTYLPEYGAYVFLFDTNTYNAYVIHSNVGNCISRVNFVNQEDFTDYLYNGIWQNWDGYIELDTPITTVSDFMGLSVGAENSKISSIISFTPFEEKENIKPISGKYNTEKINITENGTIDVLSKLIDDKKIVTEVNVNVPIPEGYIKPEGSKTVTSNGTYNISSYANVNVNVPIPEGYIKPEGTRTIISSGTYDITSFANVEVDIPTPTGSKTITSNGTFDISSFANVNVNVPIPDINKEIENAIKSALEEEY